MKIFISADIEGVCGITDWSEANPDHGAYAEFRERMTAEVAVACQAALASGATEILVKDSHGPGRNLLAERLPAPTRLLRGWSGHPFNMVQGLDDSFDAAMLVGWHAAASRGGNPLAHTLSSSTIAEIRVNGETMSEYRLHAWAAALVGVPVVFVSGDEALCEEVRATNPHVLTCAVARGDGPSTTALHPEVARQRIAEGVAAALGGDRAAGLHPLPASFAVEIRYKDQRDAYRRSFYPGATLEASTTLAFVTDDWFEVLRLLKFVV